MLLSVGGVLRGIKVEITLEVLKGGEIVVIANGDHDSLIFT